MITAVSWFLEFHLFICLFVTSLFGSLEHAVKYLSVLPPNLWPNWLPMQRWNSSSSTFRALTVVVLRVLISKLSRVRRLNCQRTWETDQAEKGKRQSGVHHMREVWREVWMFTVLTSRLEWLNSCECLVIETSSIFYWYKGFFFLQPGVQVVVLHIPHVTHAPHTHP